MNVELSSKFVYYNIKLYNVMSHVHRCRILGVEKKVKKIQKKTALIFFSEFSKILKFSRILEMYFFLTFPKYWKLISKIREIFNILENSEKIIKAEFFFWIFLTFFAYMGPPKIRQRSMKLLFIFLHAIMP